MILIKKDKAIEETWRMPSYSDPLNVLTEIRDRLNALPTIEIVRCQECKHSYDAIGGTFCSYGTCVDCMVDVDFFCKDGKRRDE